MPASQKNFYKTFIFILLGAFVVFSIWSARQASNQGSQVTDRDYYSKGLKYNSTLVEKRATEALGWQIETNVAARELSFLMTDAEQKKVSGAQGLLYLYLPDFPAGKTFRLEESSEGLYRIQLPQQVTGSVRARVTFEREGVRLNRNLQINL